MPDRLLAQVDQLNLLKARAQSTRQYLTRSEAASGLTFPYSRKGKFAVSLKTAVPIVRRQRP